MTAGDMEERVRKVVRRVAPAVAEAFSGTADLYRELGVKSVAALDLLLSLEEEFKISIPDDAFGDARTAETLVALMKKLGAEETAA